MHSGGCFRVVFDRPGAGGGGGGWGGRRTAADPHSNVCCGDEVGKRRLGGACPAGGRGGVCVRRQIRRRCAPDKRERRALVGGAPGSQIYLQCIVRCVTWPTRRCTRGCPRAPPRCRPQHRQGGRPCQTGPTEPPPPQAGGPDTGRDAVARLARQTGCESHQVRLLGKRHTQATATTRARGRVWAACGVAPLSVAESTQRPHR